MYIIRHGQRIDAPGRAYVEGEYPPPGSEGQHAEWLRIGVIEEEPVRPRSAPPEQPATSFSASPSPDVAVLRAENESLRGLNEAVLARLAEMEARLAALVMPVAAEVIASEPPPFHGEAILNRQEPFPLHGEAILERPEPVVVREDGPVEPESQPPRRGPGRPRKG